ncbi:MAG TPA: FAD-binding domain-containing protein, partial [Chitinophagaceae bacterium]|nr:FAD-binding domain-containing protein [Chitinophagaceae bacterium]
RAWQHLGDDLFNDIRRHHTGVQHNRLPRAVEQAATGIQAVDAAIRGLYETGYMHNHLRMYVASITCNVAKAYWQLPSRWMYYHLLDGDLASNTGNWQWVAGTFNGRTYYCNQDNINRFTLSAQQGTFLDRSYEELRSAPIPAPLQDTLVPPLTSRLPQTGSLSLDPSLPLLLYNSYNLDPRWRAGQPANRVLLLEPSHFRQFPVSERVIRFLLDLAANVEGLQVFTGEVQEIPGLAQFPAIYSREHPAFTHYPGIRDPRDWIFPSVQGFYSSFFAYWKKCESLLAKKEVRSAVAEQA